MADTLQIVQWALSQTCSLRDDETLGDPGRAAGAVGYARTYASLLDHPAGDHSGVFGDIAVTSYSFTDTRGAAGESIAQPCDGFIVTEAFRAVGGADGLLSMCRSCPANTASPGPAGCVGTLFQYPWSTETQQQLESIISRCGLSRAVEDAFPATTPMWFGLWAVSPLTSDAIPLLRTLISEMRRQDTVSNPSDTRHLRELDAFVRATEQVEQHGLQISVRMAPPGHTDLGFCTIFPHCPFCKAEANVERWKQRYSGSTSLAACVGPRTRPQRRRRASATAWDPNCEKCSAPSAIATFSWRT